MTVSPLILEEIKKIVADCNIMRCELSSFLFSFFFFLFSFSFSYSYFPSYFSEDDKLWPVPDRVGRQELEIVLGNEHISFAVIFCFFFLFFFLFSFFLFLLLQFSSILSADLQDWLAS